MHRCDELKLVYGKECQRLSLEQKAAANKPCASVLSWMTKGANKHQASPPSSSGAAAAAAESSEDDEVGLDIDNSD